MSAWSTVAPSLSQGEDQERRSRSLVVDRVEASAMYTSEQTTRALTPPSTSPSSRSNQPSRVMTITPRSSLPIRVNSRAATRKITAKLMKKVSRGLATNCPARGLNWTA